jgi:hypothetical protein
VTGLYGFGVPSPVVLGNPSVQCTLACRTQGDGIDGLVHGAGGTFRHRLASKPEAAGLPI